MQAVCQGSMIAVGSTLFYSHGFGPSPAWSDAPGGKFGRADGWIMASTTAGKTWFPWRQVDPNEFGCKCSRSLLCLLFGLWNERRAGWTDSGLTLISSDETTVTLGVVWEGVGGLRWTTVTGYKPGLD